MAPLRALLRCLKSPCLCFLMGFFMTFPVSGIQATSDHSLKPFSYLPYASVKSFKSDLMKIIPRHLRARVELIFPALVHLSQKHEVNPLWVFSVMWTESHFNPGALSQVGAKGVMQVMPETAVYVKGHLRRKKISYAYNNQSMKEHYKKYFPRLGRRYRNLLENMELGVYYLRTLHIRFGNLQHAIVAYNMGPGWLRYRLKNNLPVGEKNLYLNKVRKTFSFLQENLSLLTAQNDYET